ncbi:GH36-type glycosyl hydrolase domain-containing protein [Pseudomonas indica]|uniref:GH36-type glycosyl hydrolase domain-containing protein n=1 Tax=Pseudomonas indica TaxID=137658 RepID=UPI001BAE8E34|nr:glucoamylase family protein [Pseudomonas indica]
MPIWARIEALEGWLERARTLCLDPPPEVTKAAEWLLDNDYQVQRAVRQVVRDLPAAFYERLPCLTNPGEEGVPRVFAVAQWYLHASRLQLSLSSVVQFVRTYQGEAPLSIAELWAFPTMLRLTCLEVLVCALGRLLPALESPFPLSRHCADAGVFEDTECVARALANLAIIASTPWKDFFERCSLVEERLTRDPAGVYAHMDFETRDRYRKALEELARGAERDEIEVAEQVLRRAAEGDRRASSGHVGYWLIGPGREVCETALGYRPTWLAGWRRLLYRRAGTIYAGSLMLAGVAALVLPGGYLAVAGATPGLWFAGLLLALIPASVLSVTVVNWWVTLNVPPRLLPKLDFSQGIDPACATAIAVPVLLDGVDETRAVLERLELHYLANPDPALRFVLLSDHLEAPAESLPTDGAVENALVQGLRRLNERYGKDGGRPFHLLHRPRRYNPGERCWMGRERKRGKLEDFNRYLLDGDDCAFCLREGDAAALRGIRFVITVDADTALPSGCAARLVGTLAHPLNRAEFDPDSGRVLRGYTVLQPRVEIAPEQGERSLFARLYTGDTAIDIYTRAVSDVYQDLFGSGIFVGKGIYEVASFQRSLEGRVRENSLVSHDLFEGIHGRAGLVSDIVLYENFPRSYLDYARRQHRWVRGDWQLLPWLWRSVSGSDGMRLKNRLSALDRWKLIDNLRRSVVPLALVVLAAAGWLWLPGSPWVWTLLTVAAPGAYLFTDLITGLAHGRRRGAVRGLLRRLLDHVGRWFLALVFLVNDAAIALDALVRTLWRLGVSRRHLLEWTTAAHQASFLARRGSHGYVWRQMWPSPMLAVTLAIVLWRVHPAAFWPAAPLLLVWLLAPGVALFISLPRREATDEPSGEQHVFLRRLARRTWLFFETFVGPDDNWLPPDNYQEEPYSEIAHRTSPTNIGMLFVSSLGAADLGYVGLSDFAARIRRGLDTLERMERYRGHWLNWYDTRLLLPLEPRYISTVDSGNLAVCLLTLQQGCLEIAAGPALPTSLWDGLEDTFELLREALMPVGDHELEERLAAFAIQVSRCREHPAGLDALDECEKALRDAVGRMIAREQGLAIQQLKEVQTWLERLHHHLREIRRDRERLMPWFSPLRDALPPVAKLARQIEQCLPVDLPMSGIGPAVVQARTLLGRFAGVNGETKVWLGKLDAALEQGLEEQSALRRDLLDDATRAGDMAFSMDFRPLYDAEKRLFHIGHNLSADRIDSHHYDLLATEARLASYFAIMKGDVPLEHWFYLGRPLSRLAGRLSLVSWNGSMFEYLMPPLLLPSHAGSLLGQSERAAVAVQREYARTQDVPWGISESAFASRDPEHRYRYRAFGVPELGLRRDLAQDLVITPYASALALAVSPRAAVENLIELQRLGLVGSYGLYEAADFTADRVPSGRRFSTVRAYMAHHQGMIFAALNNALCGNALVRRFGSVPRVKVMELLLHERVPLELPADPRRSESLERPAPDWSGVAPPQAWTPTGDEWFPQAHLLGNGRLHSWISRAGAGGLSWHRHALTRWRPDATRDHHGLWVYVRDEESGDLWSAGRQPTGAVSAQERVVFHPHMAEFHRHDHGIGLRMEVTVATAEDMEIRRLTLTNESDRPRTLSLTSYAEVALAPPLDDERHPAFGKLFVGSEYLPGLRALLFTRRPRHADEKPALLLHRLVVDETDSLAVAFESDREAFLGRHGDERRPIGILNGLQGRTGWTLDPVMALQARIGLAPGERRQLAFLTLAGGSRESILELAERYASLASLDWTFADAASEASRETRKLGLEPERLPELQMLASLLLYPHPTLRTGPETLAANRFGQPRLWGMSLSGDHPILLLRVATQQDSGLLATLVRACKFWRRRGLLVDLVILRTGASGYAEPLREQVFALLRESGVQDELASRGGDVHLLFADQLHDDDIRLLESTARIVLDESAGPLARQLAAAMPMPPPMPRFDGSGAPPGECIDTPLERPGDLLFDNGLGGFSPDGREYVIHLEPGRHTPAPWCNVLANEVFGSLVSESGNCCSWAVNSGENRLTPWSNDPLGDAPGEALYLRDEESAEVWTPTPLPAGEACTCQIRHGTGYTLWRQHSHGLEQELLVCVPPTAPVKVLRLRLRDVSGRSRRITATCYVEWLLGALASMARPHVVCDYDAECHALLARNPWNPDFAERVAFLTANKPPHSLSTDRQDFLGREGHPALPAALTRWALGGRVEVGGDPCAAFQVHLDFARGGSEELVFVLGQGQDREHAKSLAGFWQQAGRAEQGLAEVRTFWDHLLSGVRISTPAPAFDVMVNRWLQYQTIASRLFARAGFYQAGGAIGFRDQLQDVLALLHTDPRRAREHILLCAAHQFEEGDVLHWWHPPSDRGVRTRCSDDLLWLPFATSQYVEATGDESILGEAVPFLQAPPLANDEHDRYARFPATGQAFSLFEHCKRALQRGVTRGQHGLPLMGAGDWNDGMDRVGREGRGESVWLGWFAIAAMKGFAGLARRQSFYDVEIHWTKCAQALAERLDQAAWDGAWYLRAIDDDGRPLGSHADDECRIDSISQSWSLLCGADGEARARIAMDSAGRHLVRDEERLVRLLWPPFADTPREPGYIKAYPPGIRENGGQYSHAAAWLGMAFAGLGDAKNGWRIFDLLNPVNQAREAGQLATYRVEPYVLAADIGSVAPWVGRGGWTWYSGSAAWTWRLAVESILGLHLQDGRLRIEPCLPPGWTHFSAEVRGASGTLAIRVERDEGLPCGSYRMTVDGQAQTERLVAFPRDGTIVHVRLWIP